MSSEQRSVVQAFLDGHDVFVCPPTGSGKSLCYWILPGVFDRLRGLDSYSIVVVVSPLKALMREQVEALKGRGSRAVCVEDALYEELVRDEIQEGRYQFFFCSCHAAVFVTHDKSITITHQVTHVFTPLCA